MPKLQFFSSLKLQLFLPAKAVLDSEEECNFDLMIARY